MIEMKILIICFLFWGCSHYASQRASEQSIESLLKKIQLNGEGKARLEVESNKYVFNFSSQLTEKNWLVGMEIPFEGERVLAFGESHLSREENFLTELRFHLLNALKEKGYPASQTYQSFLQVIHQYRELVYHQKNCRQESQERWECFPGGKFTLVGDELYLTVTLNKDLFLEVRHRYIGEKAFNRIGMSVFQLRNSASRKVLLNQELFFFR